MAVRVEIDQNSGRLDRFLVQLRPEIPRSRWESWIKAGNVLINGVPAFKGGQVLKAGDALETELPDLPPPASHLVPEPMDLPTLFEDDRLWIINKPAGMVVHPGPGHPSGTVLNALLARIGGADQSAETAEWTSRPSQPSVQSALMRSLTLPQSATLSASGPLTDDEDSQAWPGLVHRLDRYTSGCMAMAKDEGAKTCLQTQFKARTVEKTYLAIARQSRKLPELGSLLVDAPIARHRSDRTKMAIQSKGRPAQTRVKVLGKSKGLALVSCDILTGRTHQVRVHMASLGAPLLGDPLYGGATAWQDQDGNAIHCPHPALHAWKLALDHPNGGRISVVAELPELLAKLLLMFDFNSNNS